MLFTDLKLDKRLERALEHMGFSHMTNIQQQAIPVAMTGRDIIASSQTGSGKTLAFLIPAVQRLLTIKALSRKGARILVLAPTRELTKQVYGQLRALIAGTPFRCQLIVGGENFNDQAKLLRRTPHVIVATPGRLADHLVQGHIHLAGLELLVLDEADRMLDLGFVDQLDKINQIASHRKRQTLMFSATLDHAQVQQFAIGLLQQPQRIAIGQDIDPHQDITQRLYLCDHLQHKEQMLKHILKQEVLQQVIIFTATRVDTERLANLINDFGYPATALNGQLNQSTRNHIIDSFSRGQQQVLITTDVAARGLDLNKISHVINFDLPKYPEEYIHRIGRTGRAGATGIAISFVGPKDWTSFKAIETFLQRRLPCDSIPGLTGKFKGASYQAKPLSKIPKAQKPSKKPNIKTGKKPLSTRDPKSNIGHFDGIEGGFGPVRRKKKT